MTENATYFFAIDVEDQLGNSSTFDNGGLCFTFQTDVFPTYFAESFDENDNDLDFLTFLFTPDGSPDVYAPCTFEIINLPTDPSGGTVMDMAAEDFVGVTLPEGVTLSLYGITYSQFFVGGNGYITFEAGDDEFFGNFSTHFNQPRISALFELLGTDEGGTVSWKMLGDRIAVSWVDIPSLFQDNSNTFQVEMFFDGRIQISYLNLDDDDGLAGLSAGTGIVPGFVETDLSALPSCGPQPPDAADSEVATPVDTPAQITLLSIDDGLPDPPGQLSYTITLLPAQGTLEDPGIGAIETAPYTLTGSSGIVDYVPDFLYNGPDTFQFNVNDGGVPPDGGDSPTATVSIIVGSPEVILSFDLDVDPGWTTEGQWAFGQPTGGGSHNGDPSAGFTGTNVYGYNLAGDYANNLPPLHVTTTALDCSQILHAELRFQRWLGVEFSNFDHATVSVSNDGSSWVTVWDHDGNTISDDAWVAQAFDISDVADEQPTVFLRWTMGPTDNIVTYPGWNIDDVQVWGFTSDQPCDGEIPGICQGGNDGAPCDLCGDGSECGGGHVRLVEGFTHSDDERMGRRGACWLAPVRGLHRLPGTPRDRIDYP